MRQNRQIMIPENDNVFDLKDFLGITDAGMTVAVRNARV
jgi:hypothetical protein